MKKIIFSILGILIIGIILIVILTKKTEEPVIEDYSYVMVEDNIILDVNQKYYLKDYVTIKEGELEDSLIDTSFIGKKEQEVYYNADNMRRKFMFNYEVVDKVKPLILGGGSLTFRVNSEPELIYSFFSADNYDPNPKREIIGEYDLNQIGSYNLEFKVTDSSGNYSSKKFTLHINKGISNPPKPPAEKPKVEYEKIYQEHKSKNTLIGLDVSKWQGEIDFDLLKENKVEFIMIRVGYQKGFDGEYLIDPFFERNITEANRVGIPVGGYFYTYAKTPVEAREQALWVVNNVKDYKVTYPLVYDFESWKSIPKHNLSLDGLNNLAKIFMDTVNELGYKGMNYSSKYYLNHIWNLNDYPVWLAHYTKKTDYEGPYDIWQLTDSGKIPGINGDVDVNVMYLNK